MSKIIGNNLPDMPWQEKPAGEHMPVWRYDQNPIIGRYEQKRSNSIFNSADCWIALWRLLPVPVP